jgi:hypothetical protein
MANTPGESAPSTGLSVSLRSQARARLFFGPHRSEDLKRGESTFPCPHGIKEVTTDNVGIRREEGYE